MPDESKDELLDAAVEYSPVNDGEQRQAIDELFSITYEELKWIAAFLRYSDMNATVSPTTLVGEAWLKLANSSRLNYQSPLHFKRIAARAMRQILVEAARRRNSYKRGGNGEVLFVTFVDFAKPVSYDEQFLALHESLDELAKLNPRQALMVECRYFGGLDVAETAMLLDVSEATILRNWRTAKAWLAAEIRRKC